MHTMQTSAPFPPGIASGSYCPISAQFPQVKSVESAQRRTAEKKRPTTEASSQSKRARAAPGLQHVKGIEVLQEAVGCTLDASSRPATVAAPTVFGASASSTRAYATQLQPVQEHAQQESAVQSGQGGGLTAAAGDSSHAGGARAPLTTFEDIAARLAAPKEACGSQALEARKMSLLNMTFQGAARQSSFASQQQLQQQQQGAQPVQAPVAQAAEVSGREVEGETCVPYDWVLKRTCKLFTPDQLRCHDRVLLGSARQGLQIAHACAAGQWDSLSMERRWSSALLSHKHPEAPWEPEVLAALAAGGKSGARLLAQRLDAWRAAFTSAYMAVRHGLSAALYVEYSSSSPSSSAAPVTGKPSQHQHQPPPQTVVFAAPGTRGSGCVTALVSQSSRHLRSRLTAAGLDYAMPLAPGTGTSKSLLDPGEGGGDGDAGQQQGNTRSSKTVRDWSPQSVLMFEGAQAVHGLFDYMMHEVRLWGPPAGASSSSSTQGVGTQPLAPGPGPGEQQAADVPLLLAPEPFEGSTTHRPCVRSLGQQPAPLVAQGGGVPEQQQQHVLELMGPLPPWTITRVSAVVQAALAEGLGGSGCEEETQCHLQLVPYEHCQALNCWSASSGGLEGSKPEDNNASTSARASTAPPGLVPLEARSAGGALQQLACRHLRSITLKHSSSSSTQTTAGKPAGSVSISLRISA